MTPDVIVLVAFFGSVLVMAVLVEVRDAITKARRDRGWKRRQHPWR